MQHHKLNGEQLIDQQICDKFVRFLPLKFDYIVCVIKETKYTTYMTIKELQSTLEARELTLLERNRDNTLGVE